MNSTAYIFGNFGTGYTQYPDDSQSSVLMTAGAEGDSCISIRREGSMSWCIYRRNLSDGKFIGLAVGFNGVCCTSIKDMFSIFETAVTGLALEGRLIGFAENGTLIPLVSRLSISRSEVERIVGSLCSSFGSLKSTAFCQLPPMNYGAGSAEKVILTAESVPGDIKDGLEKVCSIDILIGERPDSVDSYAGKLKAASEKVTSLSAQNDALKEDLKKMERQKKRTTLVTVLVIAIAILFSFFMTVNVNLNDMIATLRHEVQELEQTIDEKDTLIEGQKAIIQSQIDRISGLNVTLTETRDELSAQKSANASLGTQNERLEASVASLKRDVQTKAAEISKLNSQLSAEKTDKSQWISYYNAKAKTVTQLEKQVSDLKSQVSTLQQQINNSRRRR